MKTIREVLVMATVLFIGSGCAHPDWIERTLVTVDVTGVWNGAAAVRGAGGVGNAQVRFDLQQEGPKVKGSIQAQTWGRFRSGPIDGTITGDVFSFKQTNDRQPLEGQFAVSGDEMTGQVSGDILATFQIVLRRGGSPPRPDSPR